MAEKLTHLKVAKLKPTEKRREIPDSLRGLFLIVQPSGAKSFAVRYRTKGAKRVSRKLTLGRYPALTLAEAREKASAVLRAVGDGEDPAGEKSSAKRRAIPVGGPSDDAVETVVERFIAEHCEPKLRSAKEVARVLRREVVPAWRGRSLAEITPCDVHELFEAVRKRGAPIQANRMFGYIRKLCNWAKAPPRSLIKSNPCAGLEKAEERPRDRVLDDRELALVWRAAQ